MKNKISSKQLMFSASCIIISTILLTKHLYIFAKHEAWISVLIAFVFSLIMIGIYSALANRFPGVTLIEMNDVVFGPIVGKLFSCLYLYFFFTLTCLNTRSMSTFISGFVLPSTPILFILIFFVIVSAWAVRKGPVHLTKFSTLFVIVSIAAFLFDTLLLKNQIHLKNFLPMLTLNVQDYLIGAHYVSMIPMCELFIFLMFLPDLHKPKEFGKALRKGLTIAVFIYLVIVLRDISVLGIGTQIFTVPSLSVLRVIDVADFLTRLEIIYVFLLVALMFIKVSVLYYATVSGVQRLLKFKSYHFLIYIFGALVVLYTMSVFPSSFEHLKWLTSGASPIHSTFFLVVMPVITLITAGLRGIVKQEKAEIV